MWLTVYNQCPGHSEVAQPWTGTKELSDPCNSPLGVPLMLASSYSTFTTVLDAGNKLYMV